LFKNTPIDAVGVGRRRSTNKYNYIDTVEQEENTMAMKGKHW
jgi:hypothetical protein